MITRRGLELLRSCDVVLFDRLVSPALVGEAPEGAESIFVGKTPGETSMPQAAIDALIASKAREGKRVVRLKGGDPFVFGRGADEAQALAAAGIAFEVVPGISAAVAVPAYAGIPVTHGGMSSSFAVITGHEASPRPGSEDRLASLAAGAETLILLMGMSSLEETAARLVRAGRSADEPVALIERGTTASQRTIIATLGSAAEVALAEEVKSPVTTVVGPVVNLRPALDWFERRPLFGKRIVVTRPRRQVTELVDALEQVGAEVLVMPTIQIVDPPSLDELDAAIDRLAGGGYAWIMFASVNAVERFFARLTRSYDVRVLAGTKVAAVGSATADCLHRHGIKEDLIPDRFTARDTVDALGATDPAKILLPRPAGAPLDVVESLRDKGWDVDEVITYETLRVRPDVKVLSEGVDAVAFTSPSSVEGFSDATQSAGLERSYRVVCIGPSTARAAGELGLDVDAVAAPHTSEGLVDALISTLSPSPHGTMGR